MLSNKKLKRNDKCHCKSNKKYKFCCLINDDNFSKIQKEEEFKNMLQNINSDILIPIIDKFKQEFPEYTFIDLSPYINIQNYKQYQIRFYNQKIIMFVEKNQQNESVFIGRTNNEISNIMVLYNGSYRTFSHFAIDSVFRSICNMINQ